MDSQTTERFWKCFNSLPVAIREKAKRTFRVWRENPRHPSLHFKKIHETEPIYSVRIGSHYRAIGVMQSTTIIWFWIGTHEEYNNLISRV